MNKFENILSKKKYDDIMNNIRNIELRNTVKYQERYPVMSSVGSMYPYSDRFFHDWHWGFWVGIFYMAYKAFNNDVYRCYANNISKKLYELIKTTRINHCEMGMLFLVICVNDLRINNNPNVVEIIIAAADYLTEWIYSKINVESNIIQMSRLTNSLIINAAYDITGNPKYKKSFNKITKDIFNNLITKDGRCYMKCNYDPQTKIYTPGFEVDLGCSLDNNLEHSRGYAWAIHGVGTLYAYSGDKYYEQLLCKVVKYWLNISQGEPYRLLALDDSANRMIDTTSLSIMICGLMEVIKKIPQSHPNYQLYHDFISENINYIADNHICSASNGSEALINGGVMIPMTNSNNSSNICGDYFFFEAMMHLKGNYVSCWDIKNCFDKY